LHSVVVAKTVPITNPFSLTHTANRVIIYAYEHVCGCMWM